MNENKIEPECLVGFHDSELEAEKAAIRAETAAFYKDANQKPRDLIIEEDVKDPGKTDPVLVLLVGEYENEEFNTWKLCIGREETYYFIKDNIENIDLVESFILTKSRVYDERINCYKYLLSVLENGKIVDDGFDPADYMPGDYLEDEEEE